MKYNVLKLTINAGAIFINSFKRKEKYVVEIKYGGVTAVRLFYDERSCVRCLHILYATPRYSLTI